MDKLKMHSLDIVQSHIEQVSALFPNCVTEVVKDGKIVRAIDFDMLRQELSDVVVEGPVERYQFTWPEKRKSILAANAPIAATLRPCRGESVGADGTPGGFDSRNLYIEGDNLDALKLLQETYLGKIKFIYIDPPYNTGNDFVYNDDFAEDTASYLDRSGQYDVDGNRLVANTESNGRFHTDWLNMMYARLRLAKALLTDDGVIFISIDDNEVENLKAICCEIFGRENFVGMLSVENNPKGRKNAAFISVSSEYCLIFAKNKDMSYFIENVPKKASDMVLDADGRYVHNSGKRVLVGENSFNHVVTNPASEKNYSVYFRRSDYSVILRTEAYGEIAEDLIADGYVKYYSHYKGRLVENTYTKDKFMELVRDRALDFASGKIYEKNFSDTIRIKSQLVNREYDAIVRGQRQKFSMELTTTGAGTYLKELFGLSESPFPAPKNTGFLKMLLSLIDDDDFYVLDFFSGSASLADAVLQLNAQDNGTRKFIMIQIPDLCEPKSVAYKAGYANICEIGKERIRRAGQKITSENPLLSANLDVGFRVLKLGSSNMEDVYYRPDEYSMQNLFGMADNIKPDRTPEDLLFQVMLDLGILLSSKIEEAVVAGKKVFSVADGYLIACFDKDVSDETVKAIAQKQPYYAVFRDSGFANDSVATNFEQIFETYSLSTTRKVL